MAPFGCGDFDMTIEESGKIQLPFVSINISILLSVKFFEKALVVGSTSAAAPKRAPDFKKSSVHIITDFIIIPKIAAITIIYGS